ncbi:MAG: tetratricopeptide repeat protein [Pseudomonadota bacterium]
MSGSELETLRDRALAAYQGGQLGEMEDSCRQILATDPAHFEALQLLALAMRAKADLAQAEALLRRALAVRPEEPKAINTLGVVLGEQGKIDQAIACYRQALAHDPGYGNALGNLGAALIKNGDVEPGLDALSQAATLVPDSPESLFNLANGLRAAGRAEQAIAAYHRCLSLAKGFLPAATNLAALYLEIGRLADAEALNRQILASLPDQADALNNQGSLLMSQGRVAEAIEAYGRALAGQPNRAGTLVNLATALRAADRPGEAQAELERALALEPGNVAALTLSAQDLRDRGDWGGALAHLERACATAPQDVNALGSLVGLLQQVCDWTGFAARAAELDALGTESGTLQVPAEPPLLNLSRHDDPAENHRIQQAWSRAIDRRMAAAKARLAFDHPPRRARPLTIGYLSQDFRDHPVGHLVRGLFAAHDRERVRVQAFSYGPDDGSWYRRSAETDCDRFHDIAGATHEEAARLIHGEQVDILVDLTGHTKNNRLEICALRPAPLQASYLGFPGGTGADFIDYLIGDPVVSPPDHGAHFSEALGLLPECYQVNDRAQQIETTSLDRAAFGLKDDAVVFACFNQSFKIEPLMFERWMAILSAVPDSQLWLFEKTDGLAAENLRREAAARGVEPGRLVFAGRLPKSAHLARLGLADLGLDTRIYNGHTTTSDLLWAGVPVVAPMGRHFASRVSASLLRAIELPELIADDLDGFETLAVALARDKPRLAALRAKLAERRLSAPLFDTVRLARHLEIAYETMWRRYQSGGPPTGFTVPALPRDSSAG